MTTISIPSSTERAAPSARHGAVMPASARIRAVYANMLLWSLQGWVAMFFIAAGYTKLTEPLPLLTVLMGWPAGIDLGAIRLLGSLELGLAFLSLAPLISWRAGRPLLLGCAGILLVLEVMAFGLHAWRGDVGLAIVNVALIGITAPILVFRARSPLRASPR